MSAPGQLQTRSSRSTRGNKGGHKATELLAAFRAACIYDPAVAFITLNGADVSNIADAKMAYPRPWPVQSFDLPQAAAGNQPLYTGAPAYNGSPSIQFTAANADRLQANFNIIGALPSTMIIAGRLRTGAVSQYLLSNTNNTATAGWALGVSGGGTSRDAVAVGVSAKTDGAMSTAVPEVWVARDWMAASPVTQLWVNGTQVALAGAAAVRTTPGATPRLVLGALVDAVLNGDWDFLLAAIFQTTLADSVAQVLSSVIQAKVGV